jgi:putative MATE family efflux protein
MRTNLFTDREYYTKLFRIGLPIVLQNLVSALLNVVGVVMIGQMGDTSVAAVGLANQVFFLLNLMLFGISSGAAVFTAQFWGKNDVHSIRRVLGLGLAISLTGGVIFTILAIGFPRFVLHIYTNDMAVVELGSQYLRIIGVSYLATAITLTYSSVMRSTGQVRIPVAVSVSALCIDSALNYVLIFGKLGLPVMGVQGAALGTCIARFIEMSLLLFIVYKGGYPAAARIHELFGASRELFNKYMRTALPVALNETLWSLGSTTYNIIYAHISTEAVAAINISSTIENLAFTVIFGMVNANAIMIGNQIGAGREDNAFEYGRRAVLLNFTAGLLLGGVIFASAGAILNLYKVSETVHLFARNVLNVLACVFWIRATNCMLIAAVLRSGGDTRFAMFLDTGTIWLIGVPLGYVAAFVFHLPVYFVILIIMSEELIKMIIGLLRFVSKKWINNLVQSTDGVMGQAVNE